MIDIKQVTEMQHETVKRWHGEEIDNLYEGFLETACKQHSFNFLLWHEEDVARSPDVGDHRIAQAKRAIDGYNQQRNDWIEKLDDAITALLDARQITHEEAAPMNTETPGSVIDRLSILALRLYHLEEQLERTDVSPEHLESVERKVAVCLVQHDELSASLVQLLDDIAASRKRHRTYRQFKMYNDPALNPYLYRARKKAG